MSLMKMMKQAMDMRKEMEQVQGELEKQTVEHSVSGGRVKVVARGDMTIQSISIDPRAVDPSAVDRLQEMLISAVNGALHAAKKKAGKEMTKLAGGMGLGNLLGQ